MGRRRGGYRRETAAETHVRVNVIVELAALLDSRTCSRYGITEDVMQNILCRTHATKTTDPLNIHSYIFSAVHTAVIWNVPHSHTPR